MIFRGFRNERNFESVFVHERLVDIAHDVHLNLFVLLRFAPKNGIIEQVVGVCLETALETQRFASTDSIRPLLR